MLPLFWPLTNQVALKFAASILSLLLTNMQIESSFQGDQVPIEDVFRVDPWAIVKTWSNYSGNSTGV